MTVRDEHDWAADAMGVSRRGMMSVGLFAAAAGVLAAAGLTAPDGSASTIPVPAANADPIAPPAPDALPEAVLVNHPVNHSAATPTARPVRMSTWKDPISRLDAHTARRLGVRFPKRAIMLTIDDGPHPVWTPRYLRLLAKHHVSATFNVIGEQVHEHAHLLRAAVAEGHHLGNHTFHHPLNLPSLSAHRIRRELLDTTDAIVSASGFRPRQFRAPGGVWGPDVFAEVGRQQMVPLGWDIDPRDWALPGVAEIRRAMLATRPHDIILCHDGGGNRSETYRALETVIPALLARDFHFVTLPAPQ